MSGDIITHRKRDSLTVQECKHYPLGPKETGVLLQGAMADAKLEQTSWDHLQATWKYMTGWVERQLRAPGWVQGLHFV